MRTRPLLALALSTAALAAGAAVAAEPSTCSDIQVITKRTAPIATETRQVCSASRWLVGSATKADNVATTAPTWDDSAPTSSVRAGAGSGYATVRVADIAAPFDAKFRPVFEGTFTGVLDNLAADLYLASPVYASTGTPFPMLLTVTVDGVPVFSQEDAEIDVPLESNPTETTGTGATKRMRFAVTGIAQAMQDLKMPLDGEHEIGISVINRYYGDGHTVFLYDTVEVPGGVVFNQPQAALKPYTGVKAS